MTKKTQDQLVAACGLALQRLIRLGAEDDPSLGPCPACQTIREALLAVKREREADKGRPKKT